MDRFELWSQNFKSFFEEVEQEEVRTDINLLYLCKVLDTDYSDHGGKIRRHSDPDYSYSDCSCGCKHFIPLYNQKYRDADFDFGVCINKKSKRCGLLTFEHQAGYGCFEIEKLR